MCQSSPTRLEKDLTSPYSYRHLEHHTSAYLWLFPPSPNDQDIHLHLRSTFTVFTSVRLFQIRTEMCWNLRILSFTQVFSQYPGLLQHSHPLSLLQEQLLQLLLFPGVEYSACKEKQFTEVVSKLLLDPAVLIYVICKIIWVAVIYPACVHMGR